MTRFSVSELIGRAILDGTTTDRGNDMLAIKQISGPNLKKALRDIPDKIQPKAESRALNLVAQKAKTMAIRKVAKRGKGLPQKLVRYRIGLKGDRTDRIKKIRSAYPQQARRENIFTVYMRGIPVHLIAGKQPKKRKPFVKARGGRVYHGAFYGMTKRGHTMIFKPKSDAGTFEGKNQGGRLMMPKVGVRKALNRQLIERTQGRIGKVIFQREFNRQLLYLTRKSQT